MLTSKIMGAPSTPFYIRNKNSFLGRFFFFCLKVIIETKIFSQLTLRYLYPCLLRRRFEFPSAVIKRERRGWLGNERETRGTTGRRRKSGEFPLPFFPCAPIFAAREWETPGYEAAFTPHPLFKSLLRSIQVPSSRCFLHLLVLLRQCGA